jgi:glucose-1-phosphate thymidylyltransferase
VGGEVVAVVLARGLGRRMREAGDGNRLSLAPAQRAAADAGQKAMVPIAGADGLERPFLDYVLSALADAGFRKVCLVIGDEQEAWRRRYEAVQPARIRIAWAVQHEPRGTADAVRAAEAFVAARPFVVINADNLYPVDGLRQLLALEGPGLLVFERDELARSSGIPLERLAAFAMPLLAPDHTLADIVEKPGVEALRAAGPGAPVSMNAWKFDPRIFAACREVSPSARGEFELPDAVRLAMDRGVRFRAIVARGPVLDLTRRADIANVAAMLRDVQVRL